jgi:hypothetical protein
LDLDEILYGGDAIQDDLYSILLNPVAAFQMADVYIYEVEKNP